ncbi:hypothetical protein [Eubacterium sp.]|uniref:hypothetical protein n=1 Tax=Eubacterium sp. TaxID=142586 RepID=UPI002FC962A8
MEILNCFKIEPDYNQIPDEKWQKMENVMTMVPYVSKAINPYDETGLELTRRLLENSRVRATALTASHDGIRGEVQRLRALGYEDVIQLQHHQEHYLDFLPQIKHYLENHHWPDVLVLGQGGVASLHGKAGFQLAEWLGIPCLYGVVDYQIAEDGILDVSRRYDATLVQCRVKTPVILIIGDAPDVLLQIPTLREKLKFKACEPRVIPIDLEEAAHSPRTFQHHESHRNCTFIAQESISDFMAAHWRGGAQ